MDERGELLFRAWRMEGSNGLLLPLRGMLYGHGWQEQWMSLTLGIEAMRIGLDYLHVVLPLTGGLSARIRTCRSKVAHVPLIGDCVVSSSRGDALN